MSFILMFIYILNMIEEEKDKPKNFVGMHGEVLVVAFRI